MPNEVGIGAVPFREHAQVHDVLHTRFVRRVDERLALGEHRHGVAGQDEEPVDARERDPERFGLVEIQVDGVLSFGPQPLHGGGPTRAETHAHVLGLRELRHDLLSDRAAGSQNEHIGLALTLVHSVLISN